MKDRIIISFVGTKPESTEYLMQKLAEYFDDEGYFFQANYENKWIQVQDTDKKREDLITSIANESYDHDKRIKALEDAKK